MKKYIDNKKDQLVISFSGCTPKKDNSDNRTKGAGINKTIETFTKVPASQLAYQFGANKKA